jgi:hypothetical protein
MPGWWRPSIRDLTDADTDSLVRTAPRFSLRAPGHSIDGVDHDLGVARGDGFATEQREELADITDLPISTLRSSASERSSASDEKRDAVRTREPVVGSVRARMAGRHQHDMLHACFRRPQGLGIT